MPSAFHLVDQTFLWFSLGGVVNKSVIKKSSKQKEGRKWERNSIDTISVTERGRKSGHTPLARRGHVEVTHVIPGSLSTVYSGSCALEPLGGICRKHMETGRMSTAGSAGGETRESGKRSGSLGG